MRDVAVWQHGHNTLDFKFHNNFILMSFEESVIRHIWAQYFLSVRRLQATCCLAQLSSTIEVATVIAMAFMSCCQLKLFLPLLFHFFILSCQLNVFFANTILRQQIEFSIFFCCNIIYFSSTSWHKMEFFCIHLFFAFDQLNFKQLVNWSKRALLSKCWQQCVGKGVAVHTAAAAAA